MSQLEPTYLHYIYDGLIKGSIHPENAAELPEGLIGLYEEAFDERTSVVERQQLLERFAIWALLKKEVSAVFVSEVLGDSEDEIQDFISTYSSWFNSPESGKYQLYHERLKVYLLQKLSEGELHELHDKLIVRLEHAMEEQKADEFEWYGLEFYASHLCVAAKSHLESYQNKLIELAESELFKTRQYLMSASFEWTYTSLDQIKAHFFSSNDSDTALQIEILFAQVYHKEKNSFSELLTFIEQENLDLFIKRYRALKGDSKAEIENFFYLSILVLTKICEFSFSSEKSKNLFLLSAAKVLDDSIPNDPAQFDWDKIISPKHVVGIIENLAQIDLDKILLSRTKLNIENWLAEEEKQRQALLEKNQAKVDETPQVEVLKDKLPPQDFDKIRGRRKRVEAQIECLEALIKNNELHPALELFESFKCEIQKLPKSKFKYAFQNTKYGGFGLFKVKDASNYFNKALRTLRLQYYEIDWVIENLFVFKILNPIEYKEYSLSIFHIYYHDKLQYLDQKEIDKYIPLIKTYLADLTSLTTQLKADDSNHYNSLVCTLIKINEYKQAFELISKLNFDYDNSQFFYGTSDKDYENSWKSSAFSSITFEYLKKNQINYAIRLLNVIPIPQFKDIIRKSISLFFIQKGNIIKSIEFANEIAQNKNQYFKFLTVSILDNDDFQSLICEWIKFNPKENYRLGIIQLIKNNNSSFEYIDIIQKESQNFFHIIHFLMGLYSQGKIDMNTLKNKLIFLISNIPILITKTSSCVGICQIFCSYKKSNEINFLLKIIAESKNNFNTNADNHLSYRNLIKDIEKQILNSIDYNNPFNFSMKIKVLIVIFKLNVYRPINTIKGSAIGYFIESLFKSIYRFNYYILISFKVLLFPGVFPRTIIRSKWKRINSRLKEKNFNEALNLFFQLEKEHLPTPNQGLHFFEELYSEMITEKSLINFSGIDGYATIGWDGSYRNNFLNDYLDLPTVFKRDKVYLGNLKLLSDPTSINVQSIVKSSHFFSTNRLFRFSLIYQYGVQSILKYGQHKQLEKSLNLQDYKDIYNTMN